MKHLTTTLPKHLISLEDKQDTQEDEKLLEEFLAMWSQRRLQWFVWGAVFW
jgi:hypothetical protein